MRTIKLRSKLSLLFIALAALIAIPAAAALADNINDDIADDVDSALQLTKGDANSTATAKVKIVAPAGSGDGNPGCNIDSTSQHVTLTFSTPTGVTATALDGATSTPGEMKFTACGVDQRVQFSASSSATAGNYTVSATYSTNTTGSFNNNVSIPIRVNAPAATETSVGQISATTSTYGGTTNLSATVSPAGAPGSVDFFVNGSTTKATGTVSYNPLTGVATLSNYTHGLDASTTPYSVKAAFTPSSSSYKGSEATNSTALTVNKANQAALSVVADSSATYGDKLTLSSSGGSGTGAVSYAASGSACEIPTSGDDAGKLVITSGTGDCSVTATKAGDTNYNEATSAAHAITVSKANQTITFTAPSGVKYGDSDFNPGATASSQLPVSYSSSTPSVCTILSGKIHVVGAGTCTVTALQAGDSNYKAASSVERSFEIAKAQAQVTLSNLSQTYDGNAKQATVETVPAGLSVDVTYNGSTTLPINAGNYTVVATVNDSNYEGSAQDTLVIEKANQTIDFATIGNKTYDDGSFNLSATASSGLPVSFASSTPSVCEVSDNTVTIKSKGNCTITASQAGNNNYNAAPNKQQTVAISGWDLKGFYNPVDYSGVVNTVKNGSTVPLKFEVFNSSGQELTATSNINTPLMVKQTSCDTGATVDDIELLATGGTSLRYDTTGGQFIYNWQTPKKPGTCYDVTVSTKDGSSIPVAKFKLK